MVFFGAAGLGQLEGDHIVPFSKGGLTVWGNLVLRCKLCNIAKSDSDVNTG
jgi:5-methylcytosine-specific restriction endonuclease McrA